MSTLARTYEWEFNETDMTMVQNIVFALSDEEWDDLVREIKAATCLTSIYSDLVATTKNVSKNDFNDSVNICLRIFNDKYEEISKKVFTN